MKGDEENDSPGRDDADRPEQLDQGEAARPQGRIWKPDSRSENSLVASDEEFESTVQSESEESWQDEDEESTSEATSSDATEQNALPYAVTGHGNTGYLERIHDELRRRESELARLDREIDGLMHWLERAKPKRRPFIGSAGLLSSQGNFVKELRDRLTRKRIARATMLIEVTRARERLESEE